jgi:hypothetical protein
MEIVGLGAAGGLVVGVATYPAVENGYIDLIVRPDIGEWVGFLIRVVVTSAIGAFWGYLHRPDHDRKRVFQLGLVAPAAVASLVYANMGSSSPTTNKPESASVTIGEKQHAGRLSVIGSAHAGDLSDIIVLVPVSGPRPLVDRIIKGVFGR